MAFKNVEAGSSGGDFAQPTAGPRPARLIGLVDCGVHTEEYKGKETTARKFYPVFWLANDTYETEEGDILNMLTSPYFPINLYPGEEKGNYMKFIKGIDPAGEVSPDGAGDITGLLGRMCSANMKPIVNKKKEDRVVYDSCSPLPDDYPMAKFDGEFILFDCDEPDKDVFDKLPKFRREYIKESNDFAGSELQKVVDPEGYGKDYAKAAALAAQDADAGEDDIPF